MASSRPFRFGVLCGILLAGGALMKNEGLLFAVLLALVVGLARSVPWLRRVITTALLTVLVTDSGRTYVGAIDSAALQQVAATGRGL